MKREIKEKIDPHLLYGLELKIWEICIGKEGMPFKKLKLLRQLLNQREKEILGEFLKISEPLINWDGWVLETKLRDWQWEIKKLIKKVTKN